MEVGKDADLVIWTKHPLSTYTTVERTYIDGVLYYDRKTDEARVAELEKDKAALVAAPAPPKPGPAPTTGAAIAITNARIHPITGPTIERGAMIIRGTRIAAVGADVQVPAGATIINAKGADVD